MAGHSHREGFNEWLAIQIGKTLMNGWSVKYKIGFNEWLVSQIGEDLMNGWLVK